VQINHYLNSRKESYLGEDKKSLNYYDNANDLTQLKKDENYIWLKEINSQQDLNQNMIDNRLKFHKMF